MVPSSENNMLSHLNSPRDKTSPVAGGMPSATETPTFREAFCAKSGIKDEEFMREIFNRTTYPHVRFIKYPVEFFNAYHFAADYEYILSVGETRCSKHFMTEGFFFNIHPYNRGWMRRKLLLRVSTKKMQKLVKETLGKEQWLADKTGKDFTAVPFNLPAKKDAS